MRIDEINSTIIEQHQVNDVRKKVFGEVITPIDLVEEMLDTLPDEVWTNPNLKWLDPCVGVGTFMLVIIKKLIKYKSPPIISITKCLIGILLLHL